MSRFIQGNCVHIMSGFPDNAVDFILTDPPYLVGFRDRQGRTIAGDKTDEWLQPACHEMYRVLKKDTLMVSFYGWNRVDRFMAAWKNAGFSVSQGSMYPFNGYVSNEFSPLQTSLLLSERMAFKLHRQGMVMNSIGENTAVCFEYPSPIIPKSRWRYHLVNKYPDAGQCHPLGRSVTRWETGKNMPNDRRNFGYLFWRKRNCVFL